MAPFAVSESPNPFLVTFCLTPGQVKSGGHAHNRGHSSTTGVQISMARFNGLTYDSNSGTVTIGVGLTWDQVYSQLEPLGVMVVGGRVPGVGMSGDCSQLSYLLNPFDFSRRRRTESRRGLFVENRSIRSYH